MEGDSDATGEVRAVREFLPTPSHGGRRRWQRVKLTKKQFLPTPSHGGRRIEYNTFYRCCNFYPRPHMEGDSVAVCSAAKGRHFYPRPHMEGDYSARSRACRASDFYPRPHMEGDTTNPESKHNERGISTHALTWRATKIKTISVNALEFLPTPSHGGRPSNLHPGSNTRYFYPRPHMEGDAPIPIVSTGDSDFYPRPHMEGDSA